MNFTGQILTFDSVVKLIHQNANKYTHPSKSTSKVKQPFPHINDMITRPKKAQHEPQHISKTKPLKPHSHCAGVATVHPDAGQPVYRDAPGHIS